MRPETQNFPPILSRPRPSNSPYSKRNTKLARDARHEKRFLPASSCAPWSQQHVDQPRYINILTWPWGYQDKFGGLLGNWQTEETLKNSQFWPKSLEGMLEYWEVLAMTTATVRETNFEENECHNSVSLFSRSKRFAQAKHAPTAFNSKRRYQKLAIAVRILQNTQNLGVISRCCFAEDGKEIYQEL